MKNKIKSALVFGLLMFIVNCCAASYMKYDVSVDEVTGIISVVTEPNDSAFVQFRKR